MSATILYSDNFQYNGTTGIVRESRRRTKSSQYGFGWEDIFRGTPEVINSAFLQLPDGCEAVLEELPEPFHRLTVRYADDPANATSNAIANTYELLGTSAQKDIREHALALTLDPRTLVRIQEVLDQSEAVTNETLDSIQQFEPQERKPLALGLYNDLRRRNGNMAFQMSQFVFRVSIAISRRSDYAVAFGNQNRRYTFAQLIAESNAPTGYVLSLQRIEQQCTPSAIPPGHEWSWLKGTPTITVGPGNRLIVQIDWTLEAWSTTWYAAKA